MNRRSNLSNDWFRFEVLVMLAFMLFPFWRACLFVAPRLLTPHPVQH
jgi:hypothetical protein